MSLIGPDEEQMKLIQKDTNETSLKKLEENRQLIKQWLNCQPHLPRDIDERTVRSFLRGCKHDLERTKRKLDTYFTLRATLPEFFSQRNPFSDEIRTTMKAFNAFPLPRLTPDGYRVTVHKFSESPVSDFEPCDVYKYLCMIGDIRLLEEVTISGDVFVFDVANLTLQHVAKLANPSLKKIIHCTEEGYPQRLKEIHMINCPTYVDKIVNMFKMFMKEKMRNRFHIHTSYQTLYNYMPQSILPEEYGGDAKSIHQLQDQWSKKLESYAGWFKMQENVKTDNNLRPPRSSPSSADKFFDFGTEGAFRKLEID